MTYHAGSIARTTRLYVGTLWIEPLFRTPETGKLG